MGHVALNANVASNLQRRPTAGFVRWEDPGEPVAIHFHVNAIELLERDALRADKAAAAGILLGKRTDDIGRPAFVIENYEPVPTATWRTTESPFGDRRQLAAIIDRWRNRPSKRMMVLGFYRSCCDPQTSLSEDDLSVLDLVPADDDSIFLLIETQPGRPSQGRLFMARGGKTTWEWSLAPFSRVHLAERERPAEFKSPAGPVGEPKEPPRHQEQTFQTFKDEMVDEAPLVRSDFHLPQKWQWILAAAGLMLLLMIGSYYELRTSPPSQPTSSVLQPTDADLGLKLDRVGNDWKLSWNSTAPAILKATKGQLLITDGGVQKTLNLDVSDLRGGTIVYSPLTDEVTLRLRVDGSDSTESLSETVRAVGGLPTATASLEAMNAQPSILPVVPPFASDTKTREPMMLPPLNAGSHTGPDAIVTAPSLSQRHLLNNRPVQKPDKREKFTPAPPLQTQKVAPNRLADPMKVSNERGPARTSVSSGFGASSAPLNGAEEKIPVIPASTSDSSFPEYVRKSGAIQPAQLITNVNPIYPEAAREVGVSGAVEVHFEDCHNGKCSRRYRYQGAADFGTSGCGCCTPTQVQGSACRRGSNGNRRQRGI